MLVGHYIQNLSEKGRVALPAGFRKELGRSVILSRWYEQSLALFDMSSWKQTIDQATGGASITSPGRDTERFLLGGAYEIELDSQGRFVVPKPLRDFAKLDSEVVFVGLGKRVEIWSKKLWTAREKYLSSHAEELIEEIQKRK